MHNYAHAQISSVSRAVLTSGPYRTGPRPVSKATGFEYGNESRYSRIIFTELFRVLNLPTTLAALSAAMASGESDDYYAILGVPRDATPEAIKKA